MVWRLWGEEVKSEHVVGEAFDATDESGAAPEPLGDLLVSFAFGPQCEHTLFDRAG
jgi:hypothetical protein